MNHMYKADGFDECIWCLQSLTIAMVSYMGKLRVAFKTEKDFIDPEKLKSSIQNAFGMMLKAAQDVA